MKDDIQQYLESLLPESSNLFKEMEKYAKDHSVPIMEPLGIQTLLHFVMIQKPKKILEIGTAIGYSALKLATALPDSEVITLERDRVRLSEATEFLKRSKSGDQITIIEGDALELENEVMKYAPFDAIFIDAAKGQYRKFFELYTPFLSAQGIVYSDNVLFKGLVAVKDVENTRGMKIASKLNKYNEWLLQHPDYRTIILDSGDGLAVSLKESRDTVHEA
jgi:predicted O-methyltransferase YrrM